MELNEPLGMKPPPRRPRTGLVIGAVLSVLVLGGIGLVLVNGDPRAPEAYAVATIPPLSKAATPAQDIDPIQTGSVPPPAISGDGQVENGVRVFRATRPAEASSTSGPLIIDVSKALDATPHAPLFEAPAPSFSSGQSVKTAPAVQPRIAIFVSGMGLSQLATKAAIDSMPPAVGLAFVPYGETLPGAVASAKAKGHEVLLQIPMQSGAGTAPGPHALRASEPDDAVAEDMSWLMGRFSGYEGVANLLGAPVTADARVMTAFLKAIHAKNVFFLDDGTSKRSLGPTIAPGLDVPYVRTDIVLDATADPAMVAANLDALVGIAKRNGSAVGMASGLPDHLAEIARFANELGSRGVILVPVSALAAQKVSMAGNR